MTDNYEWMKANEAQSVNDYSPYSDKQYNSYINDINNSVYSNNSLTLVNFDLGQLYNSNKHIDVGDTYIVLPITMVAAYTNGTALVAPSAQSSALCSIKSNFLHLIHQCDLTLNGKTIESTSSFINVARHFQLISEMSASDILTLGPTLGFAPTGLDSVKTMKYNATAGANTTSGNGFTNNRFIGTPDNQCALSATQNAGVGNSAIQYKIGRYVDMTANASDNNISAIVSTQNLSTEYRPYHVRNGMYCIWYDYAVIKLAHLFESVSKFGLLRRFDAQVRVWVNTGTCNVTVANPNADTLAYSLTPGNNTFSNSCPLSINYLPGNTGVPLTVTNIVAGLYIAKPPTTSFQGVNFANSGASHPLLNCRLYYSQIVVDPDLVGKYRDENREKTVVYRTLCSNIYPKIGPGANFNSLINAGVVNPTGVLVVPFLASTSAFGDSQWKSPFDSCPATTCPVPLTNFQVNVGGQNMFASTMFTNYENFISQVNLAESLTSSDFGVATGLLNQTSWEWSRYYFCNIARSNKADKLLARNINVSFVNTSLLDIDVMIFVFYSDQLTIDTENGIVLK